MTVIAMTRELGTRGLDVAVELGKRLSLTVVNDQLIERDIAQGVGLGEEAVHRYFEGTATLMERLRIDSKDLSEKTAEQIYDLALKGDVILRGWGAPYLLRDIPHVLCVRICAPMSVRENILVERGMAPTSDVARRSIERQDLANDNAMKRLFDSSGKDASLYAAMLNTGRLSVESCVEQIVSLARDPAFEATESSQRKLLDRLVMLRARAAIDKEFGVDRRFTVIQTMVVDGHVTLTGHSMYGAVNEDAVSLLRAIDGVSSVDSRITVMPYYRRHAA